MTKEFAERIDAVLSAKTVSQLRRISFRVFRAMGFRRMAYVHSVAGHPEHFFIDQVGFSQGFATRYTASRHQLDDPFPTIARRSAVPVLWSRFGRHPNLAKRHKQYLADLRDAETGDGVSVSVSGPSGKDGYFALGYGCYGPAPSDRELAELQLICQAIHNCLCDLTRHSEEKPIALSNREAQVLHWISRGKANSVIAEILGISRHTVDTLSKRIFAKLGVNDRVSAAVLGLKTGMVPHNASGTE